MIAAGWVSSLDPPTVSLLRGGESVDISRRLAGLDLVVGDMVLMVYDGSGYIAIDKVETIDTLGVPGHLHSNYSPVAHNHSGLEYVGSVAGTGASPTLSIALPSAYDTFVCSGRLAHTGSGAVNAYVRFNNDSGANYDHIRMNASPGGVAMALNQAATGGFFRTAGVPGDFDFKVIRRGGTNVDIIGTFRARATSIPDDNWIVTQHTKYLAGPATSLQLVTNSNNATTTSFLDLWGVRSS